MTRYLFVNRHYWPEAVSTGQHLTDLAEHLASRGHDVRVLSGSCSGAALRQRKGVRITRIGGSDSGKRGLFRRTLGYVGFHLSVCLRLLVERRAEIVITLTTPPLLGLWASLAQRLGGPKHVSFVMDHHPDAELELGMVQRDSWLGRTLEGLYRWTLRNATHTVVLGRYMRERVLRRGIAPERVSTIPIWSRADEIQPLSHRHNPLRTRFGWKGRTVLLYSGNAGYVHCFESLLGAIRELESSEPKLLFAFAGGGARMQEIRESCRGLHNVQYLDAVSRSELGALLSAADLHFVSLRPALAGVSVPGKLYGQLASQRPVLFVGPKKCESAEDLEASGAGIALAPDDTHGLVQAIRSLINDPERRRAMGQSGRAWFLENREREGSCRAWERLLTALAQEREPSTTTSEANLCES